MRRATVLLAAAFLAATLVAGCKSPPTKEEKSAVDYGPRPDNYEQILREYLKTRIKDPTAIVEFRAGPKPLYQQETFLRPLQYGWGVCAFINDKKKDGSFDSYPMVFYIRNGIVVTANGGPEDSMIGRRYALAGCNELGTPFVGK
jgi:hypothetical protein